MAEGEQKKKQIRIFTDGCFDMMHYGHANALRQAKLLGDYLVVGVHSDEDIAKNKGPPVMFEEERYQAVEACKWVDEVYRGAPYQFQLETLDKYDIDYVIHGDDIILTADGEDCYVHVKKVGKFKTIPRTRGVSTTDLVGRMLLMTKSHHTPVRGDDSGFDNEDVKPMASDQKGSPYTKLSKFIPSTRQIVLFSEGGKEPADAAVIGYIDGTFDLFHIGHIKILKKAKSLCDYLVVGVHDDRTANAVKGENHPLTNLHERVLAVLSCRYVDEVVIGAPYIVTQELINSQNIHVVYHGVDEPIPAPDGTNPYELPIKLGIYKQIDSECTVTTQVIIDRILANRAKYLERNRKKEEKEIAAMENQA